MTGGREGARKDAVTRSSVVSLKSVNNLRVIPGKLAI